MHLTLQVFQIAAMPTAVPLSRAREDASYKQLRQAAAMLREAAGVRLDLSSVSPPANVTDLLHQQAQSSVLTRRYPGLEVSHVGSTEALKELAVAYDLGELPAVVTERI